MTEMVDKRASLIGRSGELTEFGRTFWDQSIALAEGGLTQREIAAELGVDPNTIGRLKRRFPNYRDELENALYDASALIVDEIKQVPYIEIDAQRARVKIEALSRYLELRWPHRYGKRLQVDVRQLDMTKALEQARARQAQVFDSTARLVSTATDNKSVADADGPSDAVEAALAGLLD